MTVKDIVKLLDDGNTVTPNSTAHKVLAKLVKTASKPQKKSE
jgi:hypothetical protein